MEKREIEVELKVIGGSSVRANYHHGPHLEEIVSGVLVEDCGTTEFLQKYCSDGTINLGVGGGPFDEHRDLKSGEGWKRGCSCTFVAEALELTFGQIVRGAHCFSLPIMRTKANTT